MTQVQPEKYSSPLPSLQPPPLANFIILYFNYSYYFFLSPFRFTWNPNTGHFMVKTWLPQRVLCGIFHTFSLLVLIRDLQSKITQPGSAFLKNPVKYFQLIDSVFNLIYKATLLKRFWWNRAEFENLLQFITTKKSLRSNETLRIQKPVYIHSVLLFYTLVGVCSIIAGKNFVSSLNDWEPSWWSRRLVVLARYTFYIDWTMGKGAPELGAISTGETILSVFTVLGLLSRFLLGFFIDLSILSMTTTLWAATINFSKIIRFSPYENWIRQENFRSKSDAHIFNIDTFPSTVKVVQICKFKRCNYYGNEYDKGSTVSSLEPVVEHSVSSPSLFSWSNIYEHFNDIRILSTLVNNALGSLVIWFVLEALMYYAVNMDAFLITKDYFKRCYLLAYYVGTVAIFSFSSNICKELESIKMWVVEDGNRIMTPCQDLDLVLHEMLAKDIGLRGNTVFTITYPLFASFVGTVVTFFIICVQQAS